MDSNVLIKPTRQNSSQTLCFTQYERWLWQFAPEITIAKCDKANSNVPSHCLREQQGAVVVLTETQIKK